jgi:aryl-alcohol dehydrogenase (NADP+)
MIPLCLAEGVGILPWSPLARGFLAGNRKRGSRSATRREESGDYGHGLYYSEADYDVADRVVEVARDRSVAPAQIALAWLLHKPGVTAPIVGATKLEQFDQSVAALSIRLSEDDIRRLEEPYVPHGVSGIE